MWNEERVLLPNSFLSLIQPSYDDHFEFKRFPWTLKADKAQSQICVLRFHSSILLADTLSLYRKSVTIFWLLCFQLLLLILHQTGKSKLFQRHKAVFRFLENVSPLLQHYFFNACEIIRNIKGFKEERNEFLMKQIQHHLDISAFHRQNQYNIMDG